LPGHQPENAIRSVFRHKAISRNPKAGTLSTLENKYEGYTKVYVPNRGWEEWLKAGYPTEKK